MGRLPAALPGRRIGGRGRNVALGGWSLSTYFSDVAASAASREKFAKSCVDTFIRGNVAGLPDGAAAGVFDGLDLDWEYPGTDPGNGAHSRPADVHNATLLLQEMRRQLDAAGKASGKHYELTAALPATKKVSQYYELKQVATTLDFVDIMAYDFHGAWDPTTSFDSPFGYDPIDPTPDIDLTTSTAWTVGYYLLRGVPASKIVVGVPFYAKQYIRVNMANNGLYPPFDNTGLSGDVLTAGGSTTPTYHELVDVAGVVSGNGRKGANGYTCLWNRPAAEPWLWNPAAPHTLADGSTVTAPTFISFDDPQSLHERVQPVKGLRLRGAIVWEISQDSDSHDLVNALQSIRR